MKAGAVAAWATFGGVLYAKHKGAFDGPPPFDRAAFPEPEQRGGRRPAGRALQRTISRGFSVDGLRLVEADVRGRSVVLKPNFVEFLDGHPINTQPPLIVAAARRDAIGWARAPSSSRKARDIAATPKRWSSRRACSRRSTTPGLRFVDLNEAPVVRVPLRTRYTGLPELWVPRILRDADLVVSMPKLKTHHWVAATLSLKNCFGCMPGRVYGWPKDVFHVHNVPNSILDIVGAVRPSFAIIDGIVGMEGNGPLLGDPVHSGVVVVSQDPVAADVTGARLMGMEPEKIEYLMEAGRFLGQAHSELIEQRGEDPERLAKQYAPAPGFEHVVA